MTGNNIFITGGAGFIGTRVISKLIVSNSITIFDNFHRDSLTDSGLASHPNLQVIEGDVMDRQSLQNAMRGCDTVIHAAGIAGIDTVIKDPVRTMRTNMIGTANVLEAARINKISKRFIDLSTSEVFGTYAYKSSEEDLTVTGSAGEARWTYAVSKLAGEHLTKAYHYQFHLPAVTLRPFNIYGPWQTGEGAMHIFVHRALQNKVIEIHGDGSQIRAWCYIDDFVNCISTCLSHPAAVGQTFNVGNSQAVITILGLAEMICRVLNSKSEIRFVPPLSADIQLRIPSVEKAAELLGFKAEIGLEEGITRTANWLEKKLIANGQIQTSQ